MSEIDTSDAAVIIVIKHDGTTTAHGFGVSDDEGQALVRRALAEIVQALQ